jgi:hypothetical protein
MDRTWKQAERRVARLMGGRRVPCSGAGGGADVVTSWCAVEVKHRRRLPAWLTAALAQAERAAREGRLAVVVLHEHGQRYAHSLVVLRLQAFQEWFGPLSGGDDGGAGEDGDAG